MHIYFIDVHFMHILISLKLSCIFDSMKYDTVPHSQVTLGIFIAGSLVTVRSIKIEAKEGTNKISKEKKFITMNTIKMFKLQENCIIYLEV